MIRVWLVALGAVVSACGATMPRVEQGDRGPRGDRGDRADCGDVRARGAADSVASIGAVLDDFHDAAAHADEERYFAHFANNGVFLGTDATERWDVAAFRAYAHPHFSRGRAWSFRAVTRHVDVAATGEFAWFDETLATENLGPARGTGVLVWEHNAWRIAQYNLAITVPNDRFDSVKAILESPLQ